MRFLILILIAMGLFSSQGVEAKSPGLPHLFGGAFNLLDEQGRPVTDQDFKGRFLLITFGYTFCPDICPTLLSTFSQSLDQLGKRAERVTPVFVTVDPDRDTPEVLKNYVAHFHPQLRGLSGSEKQIAQIAKRYRVHRHKVAQPDKGDDFYLVNHSSMAFLMDPKGEFVTLFPHGTSVSKMTTVLKKYVSPE